MWPRLLPSLKLALNPPWRPTGREDVLHSGVRGEHLTRELLLLQPEVVLQVVRQHHVPGQLHGHDLTEHLQLGAGGDRNGSDRSHARGDDITSWRDRCCRELACSRGMCDAHLRL